MLSKARAAVSWRAKKAADTVLHLPSLARVTGAVEIRGMQRLFRDWRSWVKNTSMLEEIKKAPPEHRARLTLKMQETQSRRWRITIITLVVAIFAVSFPLDTYGENALVVLVLALLLVLFIAGHKPDPGSPEAEAPKHVLSQGMPLSALRESMMKILTERCKTDTHVSVKHSPHGWTFTIAFLSKRPDDDTIIKELEQGLGAPRNSITMVEDPANSANELGQIQLTDPLDSTPYLPAFGPNTLTITEPLPVGMNQDGTDLHLNMLRTNWLFVGRSDSGKSTAINAVAVRLSECRDVHLSSIDITGAVTFAVHRGCIRRRAETDLEAVKLLKDELKIIDDRTRAMSANLETGDVVSSLQPTPEMPARVLLIDELPALSDNQQFISLLLLYLMRGRKVACTAVIGTQGVSEKVAGSASFREAVHGTVLFACGELDIKNALGQNARKQGWRADTLTKQGTCYIRDRKRRIPEVSRFSNVEAQDVADRSLELQHHQPVSDIPEILSEVEAIFDMTHDEFCDQDTMLMYLENGWTKTRLKDELGKHGVRLRQNARREGKPRGYYREDVEAAITSAT